MLAFLRGPFGTIVFVNARVVGAYMTTNIDYAKAAFYAGVAFNG
jgi:hypothetical protein